MKGKKLDQFLQTRIFATARSIKIHERNYPVLRRYTVIKTNTSAECEVSLFKRSPDDRLAFFFLGFDFDI